MLTMFSYYVATRRKKTEQFIALENIVQTVAKQDNIKILSDTEKLHHNFRSWKLSFDHHICTVSLGRFFECSRCHNIPGDNQRTGQDCVHTIAIRTCALQTARRVCPEFPTTVSCHAYIHILVY